MNRGLSGRLAAATIGSPLTPLFLLAALCMGLLALMAIPREEEPQISVPMVDIQVAAPGLAAADAAELVAKPLEAIVNSIDGVDHVYTQVEDDQVLVTARFRVGEDPDDAAVRAHEKIRANYDRIPVGIPEPIIVTRRPRSARVPRSGRTRSAFTGITSAPKERIRITSWRGSGKIERPSSAAPAGAAGRTRAAAMGSTTVGKSDLRGFICLSGDRRKR